MSRMHSLFGALVFCIALPATAHDFVVAEHQPQDLIKAIEAANQRPGLDRIILSEGAMYSYNRALSGGLALPAITDALIIEGRGAQLQAYSGMPLTLLRITDGVRVELHDLTLAGASHTALQNRGDLRLVNVQIEDNFARRAAAAIDNQGRLVMEQGQIAFNTAQGPGAVAGIFNAGTLVLRGTRLIGNEVQPNDRSRRAVAVLFNQGEAHLEQIVAEFNRVPVKTGLVSGVLANGARGELELVDSLIVTDDVPAFGQRPGDREILLQRTRLSGSASTAALQY